MVFIIYVSALHRFPCSIPGILNLTVTSAGDCRGMYSSGMSYSLLHWHNRQCPGCLKSHNMLPAFKAICLAST